MPKKASSTVTTNHVADSASNEDSKKRGIPKPYPPESVIKKIARRTAPNKVSLLCRFAIFSNHLKVFRGPVYKVLRRAVVEYARTLFEQVDAIHKNNHSKTLTWKDLDLLSKVSTSAGSTPEKSVLTKFVKEIEEAELANPEKQQKKKERAEKKKIAKSAKDAAKKAAEAESESA